MGSVSSHCPESSKLVIQASTTSAGLDCVNAGFHVLSSAESVSLTMKAALI